MSRPDLRATRVRPFGTTVFAEMSALALASGAVNLGQGFPDFDAPPAIVQAATRAMTAGHNQYAPGIGVPALRHAVAAHASATLGLTYDPDTEVTITTGATEAVFATIAGLVEPGEEVVLLAPWYDSYRASTSMAGATAVEVPLRRDDPGDGWRLDPGDLRSAVSSRTRAIVVNSPHNPLGKVFDEGELRSVLEVAAAADAIVISDEVYEHLTFDVPHRSIATLPGGRERTVRISSAAKTYSVTGWKVGWACAPPPLTEALRAAKQWTTFTSGTPFQHAVADALGWGPAYLGPWREAYARRRDLLCEGLGTTGLDVSPPQGTFFVTADIRSLGFTDDMDFCRRLPIEVGVGAIPVSAFHDALDGGRGLVRFAFCKTDDALVEGISRLVRGLPAMRRQGT